MMAVAVMLIIMIYDSNDDVDYSSCNDHDNIADGVDDDCHDGFLITMIMMIMLMIMAMITMIIMLMIMAMIIMIKI